MPGQPRLDIDNSDFITNFFASLQGGCREVFDATWRKLEVLGREKDAPHPVILSRRVIVLRRQLSKSLMSAEEVPGMKQLSLDFAEIDTSKKRLYEFADLVTSLEEEIVTIAKHYRDRADSENIFDELKNQWSWGGFTTQDLKRCRLMARNTALIYNWWTIFVLLAKPGKHLEAISSRPLLLHAIGKQVNHSGQTFIKITSTHGRLSKVKKMLNRIIVFFKQLKDAEHLTDVQRWYMILSKALEKYLGG